ncbi:MAG: hypothetical protein RMK73_10730 [Geminicoccaceae bacterium]|nr:hypothetical protein [Geminicoccaceae bacterium]MDW8126103.1 hypothetical protein [Geminicoccaceae bacterium]MDW8341945.1 hypothetical protein [Geminicoccaceae bacterium]
MVPQPTSPGSRPRTRSSPRLRDRLAGAALLVVSVAFGGIVLPSALAELANLPGDAAMELLRTGQRPTEEGWLRLLDSREASLRFAPLAKAHRDLGTAYYLLAEEVADTDAMRRDLSRRAAEHLGFAIARAPAHPPSLATLAAAFLALDDHARTRRWLEIARRIVPFSPETALVRLSLDLAANPGSSAPLADRDVLAAFLRDRELLVRLLAEHDAGERALAALTDESLRYELRVAVLRAREALEDSP